jgi:hypothetical protein
VEQIRPTLGLICYKILWYPQRNSTSATSARKMMMKLSRRRQTVTQMQAKAILPSVGRISLLTQLYLSAFVNCWKWKKKHRKPRCKRFQKQFGNVNGDFGDRIQADSR